jgi:hypothetical protein
VGLGVKICTWLRGTRRCCQSVYHFIVAPPGPFSLAPRGYRPAYVRQRTDFSLAFDQDINCVRNVGGIVPVTSHPSLSGAEKTSTKMESVRPQIELEEWEIRAGLALATDTVGQESFSIDSPAEAPASAVTYAGKIAEEAASAVSSSHTASAGIALQFSRGHRCPNCGATG